MVATLVLVSIVLLTAYRFWSIMEQRQERTETEWTATMFLNVYLRDQVVPPLLLTGGFRPDTAESRLSAAEQQYGKPLRSYRILEWHFGNADRNQVADLYYEVDFKKTAEPLHIRLVHQGQDWKVGDVIWESPA